MTLDIKFYTPAPSLMECIAVTDTNKQEIFDYIVGKYGPTWIAYEDGVLLVSNADRANTPADAGQYVTRVGDYFTVASEAPAQSVQEAPEGAKYVFTT